MTKFVLGLLGLLVLTAVAQGFALYVTGFSPVPVLDTGPGSASPDSNTAWSQAPSWGFRRCRRHCPRRRRRRL